MMSDNISFDALENVSCDIKRSRLTGGINFHLDKPYLNDIRLNYEQYFYADNVPNTDCKIVLEFMVRF